ncbi:PREDICTED: clathrin light chain-like isoform X2 [Branchiostoma belcheri]|uniref:Clathrin light chain n=1 Tax=Branchiostoma belcheri TaxID=7741 RepID=A0A6P4YWX9_BRABE|nr:PREDICTED: clathrin light chain-like isoform X2 [Branchiostoma belcheri]
MADGLGDFEDQPAQQQQEEDPAAAFLAREQDELAGLEDDDVAGLQEETPAAQVPSAMDDNLDFLSGGGDGGGLADFEGEPSQQQNEDIFGADQGQPQSNGPVPTPAPRREEPEKIRKWREEQKAMLEKKDAEAERLREEWKKEAADELRKWYAQREEQLEKTKASNRSAEEAFREEVAESNPGQEWERVARMCDFNPKSSKGSKDTGRMRSILLHLKQEGLQR